MFTQSERIQIGKVIEMSQEHLKSHLIYQGELITPEIKAAVMAEVAAFALIANDGVEIFPTESNEGLRLSKLQTREEVRNTIRGLLDLNQSGGFRLLRG